MISDGFKSIVCSRNEDIHQRHGSTELQPRKKNHTASPYSFAYEKRWTNKIKIHGKNNRRAEQTANAIWICLCVCFFLNTYINVIGKVNYNTQTRYTLRPNCLIKRALALIGFPSTTLSGWFSCFLREIARSHYKSIVLYGGCYVMSWYAENVNKIVTAGWWTMKTIEKRLLRCWFKLICRVKLAHRSATCFTHTHTRNRTHTCTPFHSIRAIYYHKLWIAWKPCDVTLLHLCE